jgi:hypothetical protein
MVLSVFQVKQGSMTRGTTYDHISSLTAIATIRTAAGNKFLPSETDAAFSAIAGFYEYPDFVNKFHMVILHYSESLDCNIRMVKKQHLPFVKKTKGTSPESAFLSSLAMKWGFTCGMSEINKCPLEAFS